ncbi:vitamin B12 ABC transporter permease BtuC [Vibrio profundum]|uniref:vitamin B12 ABC transporter permease BtuC n=1 Tax=Vibrio profundum TaxID=2910247 RepID=UPI003D0C32C8
MDFNRLIQKTVRRWQIAILVLLGVMLLVSLTYLALGSVVISPFKPLSALDKTLLVELRLPRLIAVLTIGASLAVAGASLQVLLGNVLAEPGVLGISNGSSLAMVMVLFFLPAWSTPIGFMIAAVLGALVFTSLLVILAKLMQMTTSRLLLVGVALGILAGAVTTWAFYFSDNFNLRQLLYWLMGSVSGMSWPQLYLLALMLPCVVWLCKQGITLDTLMLGEIHATQLGLNVLSIRWRLVFATSILVGGAVALGGIIGFVGLVVPHLIRLCLGSENKYLLPASAILGATLLALADLIARTALHAGELPLGVVTTTLGAPIFIWMLVKNHDMR